MEKLLTSFRINKASKSLSPVRNLITCRTEETFNCFEDISNKDINAQFNTDRIVKAQKIRKHALLLNIAENLKNVFKNRKFPMKKFKEYNSPTNMAMKSYRNQLADINKISKRELNSR